MRYKLCSLVVLVAFICSGCFYYNYNRQFFAECRANVPAIRSFAISHIANLSGDDRQIINTTEPQLAAANWVDVKFTWTKVCMVDTAAPPDCHPFKVFDLRNRK